MISSKTSHTATGKPSSASHPAWAGIARDLTDIAPLVTGRDDVTVHIGPGLAGGAPGRCWPDPGAIELDSHLCFPDLDPTTIKPTDLGDHYRYLLGLGVFAHECAHAAHTRWQPGPAWPAPVAAAAALLEDLRAEAAQVAWRPLDRVWLRAASLVLDIPDLDATVPPAFGLWQAATAAGLCMGRVDAGVLSTTDPGVDTAHTALVTALGPDLYEQLQALWRQALNVADTHGPVMGALGRAWCDLLTDPTTVIAASGEARQDDFALAVAMAANALEDAGTPRPLVGGGAGGESSEPPVSDLFAYTAPPKRTRQATGPERTAATRLARALADAARRPRSQVTVESEAPPGRLNMRGALAGAAQRAAGAPVTAKPWRKTVRKRTPDPAARIGIALDVSVSMAAFFTPAATAAWMLARAAKRTGGTAAAATFGERVRTLIAPGKVPDRVPEPGIEYATDYLDVVIDALDGALGLGTPDQHARLLFLVTDGYLPGGQLLTVMDQCERLQRAGCAVIQLTPDLRGGMEACRIVEVADPIASIKIVTDAVTAELRAAARRER